MNNAIRNGFTLTELLVAMTLSVGITAGGLKLFTLNLHNWQTVEALASLEERAAFALRAIEDDLLPAGLMFPAVATADPLSASCRGQDVGDWALIEEPAVELHDNVTQLPCPAYSGIVAGSDALIIRHLHPVSPTPVKQMHAWYVDTRSSQSGQPSLRRHALLPNGRMQNQEIIPGVEDMQIVVSQTDAGSRNIQALHITLTLRAEIREAGLPGDGFRRISVRRLFYLRNAFNQHAI